MLLNIALMKSKVNSCILPTPRTLFNIRPVVWYHRVLIVSTACGSDGLRAQPWQRYRALFLFSTLCITSQGERASWPSRRQRRAVNRPASCYLGPVVTRRVSRRETLCPCVLCRNAATNQSTFNWRRSLPKGNDGLISLSKRPYL